METMQNKIKQMKTRNISRSITLGAAAVLIVLAGALFLAGCASSGDSSNVSPSQPSHQHHH
jgi:uncharacterized lipoprotein YajG